MAAVAALLSMLLLTPLSVPLVRAADEHKRGITGELRIHADVPSSIAGVCGRIAAASPSLCWNKGQVIERWGARTPNFDRLWMCMGDRERAGLDDALRRFEQTIHRSTPDIGERLHAEVVSGVKHDEPSWSARLDRILLCLFPLNP